MIEFRDFNESLTKGGGPDLTPLIDMVYNKGTGTVIILDNRTTAMTGHQDHPATGKTLMGEQSHVLDIEQVVKAVGIERVTTIDPKDVDELRRIIRRELQERRPSVIIARRKCLLKR